MITDEELERIREIVGQMRARYEGGQGRLPDTMCCLSLKYSEALLDEIDRLRRQQEKLPCPECDGEGGEVRRMGYLGETTEYCECEFCDDRMEMTALQIAERRLEVSRQYDGYMEAHIEELTSELDRLRTGTDVQRLADDLSDEELRDDLDRLTADEDKMTWTDELAAAAIRDELRRRKTVSTSHRESLRAERNRYREALEKIREGSTLHSPMNVARVALGALKPTNDH